MKTLSAAHLSALEKQWSESERRAYERAGFKFEREQTPEDVIAMFEG
jgi:hypothetical protein